MGEESHSKNGWLPGISMFINGAATGVMSVE